MSSALLRRLLSQTSTAFPSTIESRIGSKFSNRFASNDTQPKPNPNTVDPTVKPRDDFMARKSLLTTSIEDGIARRIVEAEEATTILPSSLSSRLVGALARTQRSEHMQQWLDRVKASPRWTDCPIPGVPTPHAAPWTPTRQLLKRKSYQKRGRFLVQCFEAEEVRKLRETEPYRSFPYIKEGDLVEVLHVNHEMGSGARNMLWKGRVSFTRKMDSLRASFGVLSNVNGEKWEKTWMLYSKDVLAIKVVQERTGSGTHGAGKKQR